jgi:hypothetical protein
LETFHANNDELVDIIRCYALMCAIIGIMSSGSEVAPRFAAKLEELLAEFHTLFALISHSIKPKLHHMRHIIDGMLWLGKLLSCFVTERKHRTVKASALHVFRHIAHTVLADVVNKNCEQLISGHDLFKRELLVSPMKIQ